MSDELQDLEPDDALARIRARFEQASERVLGATPSEGGQPLLSDAPESVAATPEPDPPTGEEWVSGVSIPSLDEESPSNVAEAISRIRDAEPEADPELAGLHAKHRNRAAMPMPEVAPEPLDDPPADSASEPVPTAEPAKAKKSRRERKAEEAAKRAEAEEAAKRAEAKPVEVATVQPTRNRAWLTGVVSVVILAVAAGAMYYILFVAARPSPEQPAASSTSSVTTSLGVATLQQQVIESVAAFGFDQLAISVDEGGVVTVTGVVRTAREYDIAFEAIESVDGVTGVIDEIGFIPTRPASSIEADARALLSTHQQPDLTVDVDGAILTLGGYADTEAPGYEDIEALATRVLAIDGVERVTVTARERGNRNQLASALAALDIEQVRFEDDSAELNAELTARLDAVASLIDREPGLVVQIWLFPSNAGDDEATAQLWLARTQAIQTFLIEAGADPALLAVTPQAESTDLDSPLSFATP